LDEKTVNVARVDRISDELCRYVLASLSDSFSMDNMNTFPGTAQARKELLWYVLDIPSNTALPKPMGKRKRTYEASACAVMFHVCQPSCQSIPFTLQPPTRTLQAGRPRFTIAVASP
jgi:hypothetical protein